MTPSPYSPTEDLMAALCQSSSAGCVRTMSEGFPRLRFSSSDSVKVALSADFDGVGGCARSIEPPRLGLATLEDKPGLDDAPDATELADPLRLVDVDDAPPNPEKPSVAGRDSSGNSSPVRVSFESHTFTPESGTVCSVPREVGGVGGGDGRTKGTTLVFALGGPSRRGDEGKKGFEAAYCGDSAARCVSFRQQRRRLRLSRRTRAGCRPEIGGTLRPGPQT